MSVFSALSGETQQLQPVTGRLVQPVEAEEERSEGLPDPVGAWMRT